MRGISRFGSIPRSSRAFDGAISVFDIGANHGAKTDVFLRLGARVVAVDPDETNERVLREGFLSLRVRPKPVVIVAKALSDKEAVETMWIDTPIGEEHAQSQVGPGPAQRSHAVRRHARFRPLEARLDDNAGSSDGSARGAVLREDRCRGF